MRVERNRNAWLPAKGCNHWEQHFLFCLPYAGGSAAVFRDWSEHIPPELALHPVQLPGRGERLRESPFTSLTLLVPALAQALLPSLDRQFSLFGHSMGALVAFELAHYLRQEFDLRPARLFVSGYRAPMLPQRWNPVHNLPEEALVNHLRDHGGTPEAILAVPELMEILLPSLRADFAICETYSYSERRPLDCPITAFGGKQDNLVSEAELSGWARLTASEFRLKMFAGDHFYLNFHRAELLEEITFDLRTSRALKQHASYACR